MLATASKRSYGPTSPAQLACGQHFHTRRLHTACAVTPLPHLHRQHQPSACPVTLNTSCATANKVKGSSCFGFHIPNLAKPSTSNHSSSHAYPPCRTATPSQQNRQTTQCCQNNRQHIHCAGNKTHTLIPAWHSPPSQAVQSVNHARAVHPCPVRNVRHAVPH